MKFIVDVSIEIDTVCLRISIAAPLSLLSFLLF